MKFILKSIREIREEKNISQAELSRKTQGRVPQGLISELESGSRRLTGYTAIPIANILKVDVKGLILGQEMENSGIPLSERFEVLKTILSKPELLGASKSINRIKRLDFGDRDSFGRKISKKEAKKRKGESLDLGSRDNFGIVRKRVNINGDIKLVDLLDKNEERFEQELKKLLAKT